MRTMMKRLVHGIAAGIALMLVAPLAQAGVIWTFYETSCTVESGGGICASAFPFEVGQLSLPDINSSGSYHFNGIPPRSETGDTDFSLSFGDGFAPVSADSFCVCTWDIMFDSSATELGFSVHYQFGDLGDNIDIGGGSLWSGSVGSDGNSAGCGHGVCEVAGYALLSSVSVPEPSSLVSLAGALLGIFLIIMRRGGRTLKRRRRLIKT